MEENIIKLPTYGNGTRYGNEVYGADGFILCVASTTSIAETIISSLNALETKEYVAMVPYMNQDPERPDVWVSRTTDRNLIKVLAEFANAKPKSLEEIRRHCSLWNAEIILLESMSGRFEEFEVETILDEAEKAHA